MKVQALSEGHYLEVGSSISPVREGVLPRGWRSVPRPQPTNPILERGGSRSPPPPLRLRGGAFAGARAPGGSSRVAAFRRPGADAAGDHPPSRRRRRHLPPRSTGTRFIRVLLSGGTSGVVLEGETIRAWGVDGRLAAEAAGRVALAAVGERIRWNGSRLLGDTLDAAGAPDLRVGNRKGTGRVRLLARKGELLAVAVVPLEAYVAAVVSREAAAAVPSGGARGAGGGRADVRRRGGREAARPRV